MYVEVKKKKKRYKLAYTCKINCGIIMKNRKFLVRNVRVRECIECNWARCRTRAKSVKYNINNKNCTYQNS